MKRNGIWKVRVVLEEYFSLIARSLPLILRGIATTMQVFLSTSVLSIVMGLCMGLCCCNRLRIPVISSIIEVITFVLRGIPFYIQLLIVYFALPDLIGFNLNPFSASVIALGFCSAGYVAQLVRGAINAMPVAQWEAAFSLGYSVRRSLIYIILPQMLRIIIPSINNELDSLLKSTSVISTIGMLELTRVGMNLVSREMEPVPIYLTIALIYLMVSAALNIITKKLERQLAYVKN